MFTGIVENLGMITRWAVKKADSNGDRTLEIQSTGMNLGASHLGDSIAVNGVCLTMVDLTKQGFAADVSNETLSKTTLGQLSEGSKVNLEKPLTLNTVLGGHMVSGHVDGIARVLDHQTDGGSERYTFEVESELTKYISKKGSVCIDGVSLTVNSVDKLCFEVNIIPHTQQKTIFQDYKIGSRVNIEVDMIARYLERLIQKT